MGKSRNDRNRRKGHEDYEDGYDNSKYERRQNRTKKFYGDEEYGSDNSWYDMDEMKKALKEQQNDMYRVHRNKNISW